MTLPAQQPPATLPPGGPSKGGLRRAAGLDGALSWPVLLGKTRTPPAGPHPRREIKRRGRAPAHRSENRGPNRLRDTSRRLRRCLTELPPSTAPTAKEASGCFGCKSATSTKFAVSSEAGHDRIADAFACGGDRGAGRVLLNPSLPLCCLACLGAHNGARTMMPVSVAEFC